MSADCTGVVLVTAAIVERDGEFLLCRRLAGTHLAGLWEFPGGKCEPGESHVQCLRRELFEELGVDAAVGAELFRTAHAYPDRTIQLHFYRCTLTESPRAMLGQQIRWVRRDELQQFDFPEADRELIAMLTAAEPVPGRPSED